VLGDKTVSRWQFVTDSGHQDMKIGIFQNFGDDRVIRGALKNIFGYDLADFGHRVANM